MNILVGESQSNCRAVNAVNRVQHLIKMVKKDALASRLSTTVKSSDPVPAWMVEWSAGLNTRYVRSQIGRTASKEARGQDGQAPVAVLGENAMHMTSKKTSKSGPKMDAKFHDGKWLGLTVKSDESIIGTPREVIKAKTVRRLPEYQRWRAEKVMNIRGVPSNPIPGVGGDHVPLEANEARHAELGENEHVPAQERGECDTRTTVAAPDRTLRRIYVTFRACGVTEGCPERREVGNGQIDAAQQRMQTKDREENRAR